MSEAARQKPPIRPARASDAEAIAALLGELGYPAQATAVHGRLERMRAEPGQSVIVAQTDGEVVGLASLFVLHVISDDAPVARLAALVVAEGSQRRGIGAALVSEAERIARKAGCSLIEVTSGDHRPQAHAFYRELGFEERPRRFVKRLSPSSHGRR